MGNINWGRVFAGGMAAGFVMNVMEAFVAGPILHMDQMWRDGLQALGKTMQEDALTFAIFIGLYFLLGIAGAWLYAAIRPRYGAGPKTAVIAGVAVWALSIAFPQMVNVALHLFPRRTLALFVAVSLVEFVCAMLLAGWIYRESGNPSSRMASA